MRRLLLSLGLAVVVGGAVLGAAASLSISPASLGANQVDVGPCDADGATLRIYPAYLGTPPGFLAWIGRFGGLDDNCLNRSAKATFTKDGTSLGEATDYFWSAAGADNNTLYAYFYANPNWVWAEDVNDAHLVIN